MKINDEELKELISELIDFTDKKVLEKEKTTKGAENLKYKVYTNSKNEYFYNEYLVKGSIGHGNLFNEKYAVNYCKKFNYFEIVNTVNRLLNIFKQKFESV
ncbi:MAG: hypothetical protein ACRCZ0_07820 [Cetobacterium sp.]